MDIELLWFMHIKQGIYIKNDFQEQALGETTEMYTHLVGRDNYYLEYTVKVGAFNDHGSGPNSTETIVMSAEGSKWKFIIETILRWSQQDFVLCRPWPLTLIWQSQLMFL